NACCRSSSCSVKRPRLGPCLDPRPPLLRCVPSHDPKEPPRPLVHLAPTQPRLLLLSIPPAKLLALDRKWKTRAAALRLVILFLRPPVAQRWSWARQRLRWRLRPCRNTSPKTRHQERKNPPALARRRIRCKPSSRRFSRH